MKTTLAGIGCVCLLLLTGCGSTSRQYVPLPDQNKRVDDSSKGRIYVMRPASGFWETASMKVSESGQFIGATKPRSFICWEMPPGDIIVTSKAEGVSRAPLTIEAGQVYYIFQHLKLGWVKAGNHLEIVSEPEGREVLKKCKPPKVLPPPQSPFEVESSK